MHARAWRHAPAPLPVSHLKATEASLHVAGRQTALSTYSNSLSEPLPRPLVEVTPGSG